jgi:tetratricopeptide (TPR) repeat protein
VKWAYNYCRFWNQKRRFRLSHVVAPQLAGGLYPAYARGQAYLAAGDGTEAAVEFQKVRDQPGVVQNDPIGALVHLGLARAYALQGDMAKSRAAYQHFLALWKDADPNISILKQAKAEYAKLRWDLLLSNQVVSVNGLSSRHCSKLTILTRGFDAILFTAEEAQHIAGDPNASLSIVFDGMACTRDCNRVLPVLAV